jgi:hypothetical protein
VNQSNTSGATSGVGHPSKASKSSFQNIKEFLLKHQRVPSKSPEFLPNHQRVPSKASKSSFQSIKEFLPKHQRFPSTASKSSFQIIKEFLPQHQRVPSGFCYEVCVVFISAAVI